MSVYETFTRACATSDVPRGGVVPVEVGGTRLAIVQCEDGSYHAAYDECTHEQIALSEGEVDGCTLECWLHGSRFDLLTGDPTGLPATVPLPIYPVEIRDGDVYVSLSPANGVSEP